MPLTDWQPIATAPKDGTTVLCYFPLEGLNEYWCRVVPVFYNDRGAGDERWVFASRAASGFSHNFKPSHWMPLPDAPTS